MSLYDLLRLPANCTNEELKIRYYELAKAYHPNSKNGCYEKYLEVISAYGILKDKYKRNYYNNFGEDGIKALDNGRKQYFMLRIFDYVNIKLLMTAFLLIIMNISLLPLLLNLNANYNVKYYAIWMPVMMACILLIVNVIRSIKHCSKYKTERMTNEMIYLTSIGTYIVLLLGQIVMMCMIIDFKMVSYRFAWLLPYYLIEIIAVLQNVVLNVQLCQKDKRKYIFNMVVRIIIMHLYLVPVHVKYKVFIPLIIGSLNMLLLNLEKKVMTGIIALFSLYLAGYYICLAFNNMWIVGFIGAINVLLGLATIMTAKVMHGRIIPKSSFNGKLMLEYDV